jgi:hypothetical protein
MGLPWVEHFAVTRSGLHPAAARIEGAAEVAAESSTLQLKTLVNGNTH